MESQICYLQIEQEYVVDQITKYLKENEISDSKGVAVLKIDYKKGNDIRFYLTSIIYRSTLLSNLPSYYTIVNGQPILIYQSEKETFNIKPNQTNLKKILHNKLLNNLNNKGKINKEFIPVTFDPSKYIIHFKDGKLLQKERVGFVPGL